MDFQGTYTVFVTGHRSTAAVREDESGTGTVRVKATSRRTAIERVLRDATEGVRVMLGGRPIVFDHIITVTARKGAR